MFDIETEYKIFNEIVSPGVVSEVRSISKLADKIKKSFDTIDAKGKYASQKMNFGGSQAYGARSNDYYPTPQEITPAEALLRVKRMEMFSLGFEGLSLELAQKQGCPIDPVAFEQDELIKGIGDDMSRQLMGDGSGKIADCNGLGSGTATLVIDSAYYKAVLASLFFKPKRVIDIYTPGSTQKVNSIAISSVDSEFQLTLASVQTWADDDAVYSEDAHTATEAVGKGEVMGILGIVRDTDPPLPNASAGLQGLTVASYADWKAKVWANGGVARPFDEDLLVKALLYHERFGTKITVMLITQGIFRLWKQHLEAYKVISDKKMLWGGWDALPFYYAGKEIPMVADLFVPDGNIIGLAEDQFTLHLTNKNWITWESGFGAGQRILQKVAGRNAYVAEGHIFGNMGVKSRAGSGWRITDIEESD